jgi:AraC family transcriptional regulator
MLGDDGRNGEDDAMKVRIETLPTYRVAFMRNVGAYGGAGGVPQLWPRMAHWAASRGLWTDETICLGIARDDPSVTEPAQCRYDVAIVVPDDFALPPATDAEVGITDIPGGTFAVVDFVGTPDEAGQAWGRLFSAWLPGSGFQLDDRPCFDRGRGGKSDFPETGLVRAELCLAVRPAGESISPARRAAGS